MAFDVTKLAKLSHVQDLGNRVKAEIQKVADSNADAIKHVVKEGNKLKLYTVKNPAEGATPAYTIDYPAESFLDQAGTTFATSFTFSAGAYPNTDDPHLDGRPVIILAVKTTDADDNSTINYSFIDVKYLVDTYKAKAGDTGKALIISGYEIELKISQGTGNALSIEDDGLFVDISSKADRDADAAENNIAKFDRNGNPVDAGFADSDVVLVSTVATNAEAAEMLETIFPTIQGGGE